MEVERTEISSSQRLFAKTIAAALIAMQAYVLAILGWLCAGLLGGVLGWVSADYLFWCTAGISVLVALLVASDRGDFVSGVLSLCIGLLIAGMLWFGKDVLQSCCDWIATDVADFSASWIGIGTVIGVGTLVGARYKPKGTAIRAIDKITKGEHVKLAFTAFLKGITFTALGLLVVFGGAAVLDLLIGSVSIKWLVAGGVGLTVLVSTGAFVYTERRETLFKALLLGLALSVAAALMIVPLQAWSGWVVSEGLAFVQRWTGITFIALVTMLRAIEWWAVSVVRIAEWHAFAEELRQSESGERLFGDSSSTVIRQVF